MASCSFPYTVTRLFWHVSLDLGASGLLFFVFVVSGDHQPLALPGRVGPLEGLTGTVKTAT
jgi:hypothetical protein